MSGNYKRILSWPPMGPRWLTMAHDAIVAGRPSRPIHKQPATGRLTLAEDGRSGENYFSYKRNAATPRLGTIV